MRIIYAGNNMRGIICLEELIKGGENIVAAIAHPIEKEEGGYYQSIKATAEKHRIPVFQPKDVNSKDFIDIVKNKIHPDLMIMVGYSQLVREELYSVFPLGCLNLHASPLPFYRGAAPLNWLLINGESQGAISIINVDSGIDTGDIIAQKSFEIKPEDNIRTLTEKVNKLYPPLLIETLRKIKEGSVVRKKQNPDEGSCFTRRFPRDGKINWVNMSCEDIHNLVRALTKPYPGAFTFYEGKKVFIWETQLLKTDFFGIPGRIAYIKGKDVAIIAKDRGILITSAGYGFEEKVPPSKIFKKVGSDLDSDG